ncbi:hypothetical protein EZ242_07830 [Ramlibacter rhizophilus]|uniref:Uncharacterized protein n=2 Tax=Ramlibacter rhizophilus TaxID=1781167 RepID=A0A4Z0BPR4_9BURK|nr:hypothetical protein EZ242_07830 [Ramlibacter rhizophilus]
MDQLKQRIDKVEECADEAKNALQAGSTPNDLRECVEQMHQQARQAKQMVGGSSSQSQGQQSQSQGQGQGQMDQNVRSTIEQLEQTADRAMQACRQAGSSVSPQLQQAVQKAHAEASGLKKQIQMG